jgi:hypothetical protein
MFFDETRNIQRESDITHVWEKKDKRFKLLDSGIQGTSITPFSCYFTFSIITLLEKKKETKFIVKVHT